MTSDAPLDWKDIKKSAEKFVNRFKKVTKEASYKQIFWSEFLQMFGVDVIQVGAFEYYVKKLGVKQGEIDYFWPGKVIIEHKSSGKDLDAAMDQAMDYLLGIEKKEELPRYIIVSDFKRIRVMDLIDHKDTTIKLEELPNNLELFGFLAGYSDKRIEGQHPVNVKAAELMAKLYVLLKKSNYPREDCDLLLIRLVFCMFAEDADIFDKNKFSSYLSFQSRDDGSGMGSSIQEVFSVLDTPLENRQKTMSSELQNFPYVNGGLFSKRIETPQFDREMRDCFFEASRLDWKYISPAIFGSLFQCIMDPELRRELGAHYTSEENILKAINPLFMDDLRSEYEKVKKNKKALREFWDKLSAIKILDPACGCGNFLIISYREMRRLEMDVLESIYGEQMIFDESHLFVDHYYGIELEEFPSMVANLSMILMDHLMNMEMRARFGECRDIIPLKEKANIICADSLDIDWKSVIDPSKLTYIVGNPPFVGGMLTTPTQKEGISKSFGNLPGIGELDFVTAWYAKAANYLTYNKNIRVAFVSTNSICQGEQATILWKYMFDLGVHIDFAYTTFVWNNEAKGIAKVHCVIVGFSKKTDVPKYIYSKDKCKKVSIINQYLAEAPIIFVEAESKPLCPVPAMRFGSMPRDGGNLIIKTKEERDELISKEPLCEKWIHLYLGADEFINGKERWCLWLVDANPEELKQCPMVLKRIEAVRNERSNSKAAATRKFASTPQLFCQIAQPDTNYIMVPGASSEKRDYVPIGFMDKSVIASNAAFLIPDATLYHFGIITSDVHMIWMRSVCGRLKSDYRYAKDLVYNTFIWPTVSDEEKKKIESCADEVLKARNNHSDSTLADLYNPSLMPADLVKAHENLNKQVRKVYGLTNANDDEVLSKLLKMYKGHVS